MEEEPDPPGDRRSPAEPTLPGSGWVVPIVVGLFLLFERALSYPASWLFVPDREIWPVQIGSWLLLLGLGAAVAGALRLLVVLLGIDRAPAEPAPGNSPGATGTIPRNLFVLAATVVLAFQMRTFWPETIPSVPWVDTIFGIESTARAGRWLAPHELVRAIPPEIDPASRARSHGLAIDYVRIVLSSAADRMTAYVRLSAIPGALLPLAIWLLARRLSRRRGVPEIAALLAAVWFWPVVMARIGVALEPWVLLTILALERTAAGLEEERAPRGALVSLAAGGALAGLSCHFYLAGYVGVGALALAVAFMSVRRRRPSLLVAFLAGAFVLLLPIAVAYLPHPELFASRARDLVEKGYSWSGPFAFVGKFLLHAGLLFFSGDPLSRHSRDAAPPMSPVEVTLFALGLVVLLSRSRRESRAWLPAGLLAGLLFAAGAAGTPWNLSPNSCRTEVVGPLAAIVVAEGMVAFALSPRWSPPFRFLFPALALIGIGIWNLARLVDWGCPPPPTEANFGQSATHAGRFAAIAGPDRVVLDPRIFLEHSTPYTAAFQIDRLRPLEPLRPPIVRRLEEDGALGAPCPKAPAGRCVWYVSFADPAGRRSIELGTRPDGRAMLRAIDIRGASTPDPAKPTRE